MPNYKLLDEIDVLISSDVTPEESKLISKYLKAYKAKHSQSKKTHSIPSERAKSKAKVKR